MENCYLLTDGQAAVLIDPGDEAPKLLAALEQHKLRLKAIWLTHAHFDHIGAVEEITQTTDVPVYLHPADTTLYTHAKLAADHWGIPFTQPSKKPQPIQGGGVLTLGDAQVSCLFTPGHAPGHIAFYLPEQQLLIAGDTLFQGSIGRTDLPGGDYAQLIDSIERQLLVLPDETVVYPGHGPATTIGQERRTNPFLR
jgi:glyoxylase-like metal-dependent hydrolase (beta-lactamase superfamily II)